MNLRKLHLSRTPVSLFIVALHILLFNNVYSHEVNTLSGWHSSNRCTRRLADMSPFERGASGKTKLEANRYSHFHTQNRSEVQYGYSPSVISPNIMMEEIEDLFSSYGPELTESEMYINFYYQNDKLNEDYKDMIRKLKDGLQELGDKNGVSKEGLSNYLLKCEKDLNENLKLWNDIFSKDFHLNVGNKKMCNERKFKSFLRKCENKWLRGMKYIMSVWTKDFMDKVKQNQL
ncbi:Plasmodium exported protein, unknown function [Plasmodium ovale]|uniref:Plasmodium RESA N-terminal domain-containing protein n=1 Tax=Plasmodium ovale TaxID=36330 RepID=A0A1D3JFX7_PLAOA|nr:Plasmodium exported protein, unknown function [Plasmodium ovale]